IFMNKAPFALRLQRRLIHYPDRNPVLRMLYLLGLAALRLSPRGALTYWRTKLRPKSSAGPVNLRLRRGRVLRLRDTDTDLSIFEQIFLLDDCSIPAPSSPLRFIIDAGAHIGCSSLFFAARHPLARILAVEAHPGNYAQLVANTKSVDAIHALHGAVFHRNAPVSIANPSDRAWGFQVQDRSSGADEVAVQGHTIPDLMRIAGFPKIDLLKLDIEGAERDLFEKGGAEWLRDVRMMIVEFHDEIQHGCTESFLKATAAIPHSTSERMDNLIWKNHLHDAQ
ncbi:MAG: hypothetical protein RLZZ50_812, partial [Verrucomicrobiota bacterium]